MVIHYPPERLRSTSARPTAITNVLVTTAGSSSTNEIPLGAPTCSARSRRGRWALYPSGEEVVVVWPGSVLTDLAAADATRSTPAPPIPLPDLSPQPTPARAA
jgi:hypothetical protein